VPPTVVSAGLAWTAPIITIRRPTGARKIPASWARSNCSLPVITIGEATSANPRRMTTTPRRTIERFIARERRTGRRSTGL
jgi:hypothetical protein